MNYLFRIQRNIMMLMSRYLRGGFALAGAAKLLNFMQRADEMDAAQYNRRANKINKMHLLRTKPGAVFIYNKRGQILNKKSGWVPMGTILRRPKGLYTIKGKKYYYFGKGLFFPKSGTEPYRIPKKHISTAGENFANWFNWLRTR